VEPPRAARSRKAAGDSAADTHAEGARAEGPRGDTGTTGVWIVGARGAIATCVAYGLAAVIEGLLEPIGLATEAAPLDRLDLVPLESIVLGGHDVCHRDLSTSAAELVRARVLTPEIVVAGRERALRFEQRIRPGILDAADTGLADVDRRAAELGSLAPREALAAPARRLGHVRARDRRHSDRRRVPREHRGRPRAAAPSGEALAAARTRARRGCPRSPRR
jgi:hypothetical protein